MTADIDLRNHRGAWSAGPMVDERLDTEPPTHSSVDLLEHLESMTSNDIDQLPFGVIGFSDDEHVTIYNTHESEISGIDPVRVIGADLFVEVAPCTNNYLVAERYRAADVLDEQLSYVFTLRMKPTPVELRLLAHPDAKNRYMIIVRPT